MRKIHCDVREKDFYDDESCWYQQGKVPDPTKTCVKCDYYQSLPPKPIKKKDPIEKATNQFSKTSHTPKDNINFYLHIYKKINEAKADSKFLIKVLKDLNNKQLSLLEEAIKHDWLTQYEASYLWGLWQYFLQKQENTNKFSIKTFEDLFITRNHERETPKKGRRVNPALEFLFVALVKDAEEFGGKPCYKQISELLFYIDKRNYYRKATLKSKHKFYHHPGEEEKRRIYNALMVSEALIQTKAYFDAKRESFLPDPIPTKPKGYVRNILQTLGVLPEKIPHFPGIRIPGTRRLV